MTKRYFSPTPITGPRVTLKDPEAHHLAHVMRAEPGDRVILFDGGGSEFEAEIERLDKKQAMLSVIRRIEADRELPAKITLAVALPKGERQRWLTEKAVELGVASLVPLVTERSVARPKTESLARLRRTVIEASKQCGRNRLMQIQNPRAWHDFLGETSNMPWRLLAHPGGTANNLPTKQDLHSDQSQTILAAVGPEGGFTEEETQKALETGWQAIDLGKRILRTETAAVLLAGIISRPFLE